VSLCAAPSFLGLASWYYLAVTLLLGLWFLVKAIAFTRSADRDKKARRLFFASIFWLPLQLGALVVDRIVFH
jgi:protoheme IX farnesyltransferase